MKFKYFSIDEFKCKHCGENHISPTFVKLLDEAREVAGIPFKIVSGYRCPIHNEEVGGVKNSAHIKGLAADIAATGSRERFLITKALIQCGIRRIGVYDSFIHCDIDIAKDQDVMWKK